jgi:hypothetical protein
MFIEVPCPDHMWFAELIRVVLTVLLVSGMSRFGVKLFIDPNDRSNLSVSYNLFVGYTSLKFAGVLIALNMVSVLALCCICYLTKQNELQHRINYVSQSNLKPCSIVNTVGNFVNMSISILHTLCSNLLLSLKKSFRKSSPSFGQYM